MSNYKFTPEHLYESTNKGLDIILKYCPDAKGCENGRKLFKLREDENTASASIVEKENCFVVKDFGDKGYNPIELCRYFTGLSFIEALKLLYSEFNVGDSTSFIKPNTTFKDEPDKELGWYEIKEAENFNNLDVVGRFVSEKIASEYDFIAVKEYSFVFKNKKTDLNTLCTIVANENFPIFAYKNDTWAKIYQPLDQKHKHSHVGKRPERHIFGLTRLKAIFDETIDNFNLDIAAAKKAKNKDLEQTLIEKRDSFKIDSVFICSGGSDGLGVASLGYNAIWWNSEGDQMNFEEWQLLNSICHNIYNLPDIDKAGVEYAYKLAETYWNLPTIWLPESIKKNNGKDFRDWLKKYSKSDLKTIQYHFRNLISGALRMKFFDTKRSRNSNLQHKLRFEFLCYFLNIKGFYTYKIQQKNLDNTAPELIIYIKIEGKIVTKVSPRIIREFTKQFLREKGQPIEVLELVSMSTMLNDNNLVGLKAIDLDFTNYTDESQYFFFQNNIAEITANEIKLLPQNSKVIKKFVWEQSVKKHNILPEKPFFEINKNALNKPVIAILRNDSEYLNYLCNTSRVFWRDELEVPFGENQTEKQKYHEENRFNIAGECLTDEQKQIQNAHLCNKIFAIGYLMHRYKQDSFAKMVIVTDDKPKELEDEANGGSGKSVMFKGVDTLLSNRHWLEGKNKSFENDKHVLQGLTKENDYIIIEDAHPYFDINFVYNWITGSIVVNPKNSAPYEIHFDDAGKLVLTTNYGVRNFTASTKRRLLFVTTSDYYHADTDQYNEERKVSDDFGGKDLFKNWTAAQWNKHYNFLLQCCQTYLAYRGEEFKAPANNIEANNIKASLGDAFTSWADSYFTNDYMDIDNSVVEGTLNKIISRKEIYKSYTDSAGRNPKLANAFKKALKDYCNLKQYVFNPKELLNADGYIKRRGNKELGEPSQVECFCIKSNANPNELQLELLDGNLEPKEDEPETDLRF